MDRHEPGPLLPERALNAHKGTMGRVVLIAGSRRYAGAAVLAAHGASRGGAGLIQAAVPQSVAGAFAVEIPSVVVCPLPETGQGRVSTTSILMLRELARSADVLVIGPGLGQSLGLLDLVQRIMTGERPSVVLDADGLNLLSQSDRADWLRPGDVMTPHPLEAARLMGETRAIDPSRRGDVALELARKYSCIVVLKGPSTCIAAKDVLVRNNSGNAALATGGTGDVLTGVIGALLARGMSGFDAAQLGVWAHGAAVDDLVAAGGPEGLQPIELAAAIPSFLVDKRPHP